MKIKSNQKYNQYYIAHKLLIAVIGFLLIYSLTMYFIMPATFLKPADIIYYFLPILILFTLLQFGKKHEKIEGIALLFLSFIFLGIYHVYVSFIVFLVLACAGAMHLVHDHNLIQRGGFKKI